jgi:hypothetical protein
MSKLQHLTREGQRQIIEDMAMALIALPEINHDHDCIMALLAARFRAAEIFDYLDAARDIARQTRLDEGELWAALQFQERDPDT